jgi:signal transduction histidine kinase
MKTEGASSGQQEYLDLILESCQQIQHMIAEILDVNRIDKDLQSVLTKKISASKLMNKLQKYFEVLAREKQISLHFDLPEKEVLCTTDEAILYQILSNLLSNAIKFSKPGSSVEIRIIQNSPFIVFEVTDHGPGIEEVELPLLFKKFQKLKARPTNDESSTGLGLFIVNRLVTLLKGNVGVISVPNQHTTFTVSIPE